MEMRSAARRKRLVAGAVADRKDPSGGTRIVAAETRAAASVDSKAQDEQRMRWYVARGWRLAREGSVAAGSSRECRRFSVDDRHRQGSKADVKSGDKAIVSSSKPSLGGKPNGCRGAKERCGSQMGVGRAAEEAVLDPSWAEF